MSRPNSDEFFVDHITSVQQALFAYILVLLPNIADASDVLQETNLVLWRKRDEFRLDQEFLPWARAIARYQVLANLKQQHRNRLRFSDTLLSQLAEESVPARQPTLRANMSPWENVLTSLRLPTRNCCDCVIQRANAGGDCTTHGPIGGCGSRRPLSDSRRVGRLHPRKLNAEERGQ